MKETLDVPFKIKESMNIDLAISDCFNTIKNSFKGSKDQGDYQPFYECWD
jgi:hypothetical protein